MKNGWLGGEDQNSGSRQRPTRWLTPRHIVDALGTFDLDPAGAPGYALARRTYVPENGEDGLSLPWEGRVWLNPPYGRELDPFLSRMSEHGNGVALLFARTETKIFFRTVWESPSATAVLFFRGRLAFLDADQNRAKANAGAPSCLVAYGENNAEALEASNLGRVVMLGPKQKAA